MKSTPMTSALKPKADADITKVLFAQFKWLVMENGKKNTF